MFGLATKREVEELKKEQFELMVHTERMATRMKLLEKRLGVTFSAGKRKAHYKVAGKVGRPRKHKAYEQV